MNKFHKLLTGAVLMALSVAAIPSGALLASDGGASAINNVSAAYTCPTTSGNNYQAGVMYQIDPDNPVRPDTHHADKNLKMRSYKALPPAGWTFWDYGRSLDSGQPPQFATLFSPARVPVFSTAYQVYDWNWPPNSLSDGTRGNLLNEYQVTALGLQTTPGEPLKSPQQGRDLGSPWGKGSAVIYADADSITLKFTREDSAATGYTVHVQNICTDPNLLALYASLNASSGPRYKYPKDHYNLPGLTAGQVFGTARNAEIVVAIADVGTFQDPRSLNDWWRIRPPTPDLSAPFLSSPSNGISLGADTAQLSWTAGSYSSSFLVQVSQDSGFSSTEVNTTQGNASLTTPSLLDGRHYWRVRGYNASNQPGTWSGTWSFVTDTTPPAVPVLSAPKNLALSRKGGPKLSTKKVSGAAQYEFRVSDTSNFAATLFDGTSNRSNKIISPPLDFGVYFWQARASDAAGNTSDWSSPFSFTYTLMTKPKNGSSTSDTTPVFAWKAFSGALGYEVRVTDDGSFDTTWPAKGAKLTPAPPLTPGLYHWQVRVNTASGWSNWMPAWDVTIAG